MVKGLKTILEGVETRKEASNESHWFQKGIEEGFLKEERTKGPRDHFYAGLAFQCPRFIQYVMEGKIPYQVTNFRKRRAFEIGNAAHERYQHCYEVVNRLVEKEHDILLTIGDIVISGRLDMVILGPQKEKVLCEIKTIRESEFKGLKKPKREHFGQWMIYAKATGIWNGLIIYENKSDENTSYLPEMKVFEVAFDQSVFDEIILSFISVQKAKIDGIILPRPEKCPNPFCDALSLCN